MPGPTMTLDELAQELGRSADWVHRNWREQMVKKKLPRPLNDGIKPLAWSRAHVYAFLDKDLTAGQRAIAAAFRLADDAAAGRSSAGAAQIESDYKTKLDTLYAPGLAE